MIIFHLWKLQMCDKKILLSIPCTNTLVYAFQIISDDLGITKQVCTIAVEPFVIWEDELTD